MPGHSFKYCSSIVLSGASIMGCLGSWPQILGREVVGWSQGGHRGSWTGREKLLYLIMYRKNVRKWLLL